MQLGLVLGFVAAVSASKQSLVTLSAEEKDVLRQELQLWKNQFENVAQDGGFMPETASLESEEIEDMHLERLLATKFAVERAKLDNPDAEFTWLNPFALLTSEEFARYVQVSFNHTNNGLDHVEKSSFVEAAATQVDWSTNKCNPPVHDQGQCGSCWAFSAVGAVEFAHCLATGKLYDLSEQQVVSCSKGDGDPQHGASRGCDAGFPGTAMNWMRSNNICLDSAWPYTSGTTGQTGQCSKQCAKLPLTIGTVIQTESQPQLQSALNSQPVIVSVYSGNDVFRNYKSGIISNCPKGDSDHTPLAFGYYTAGARPYFKIKNSWGTSWGENGYAKLLITNGATGACNIGEYGWYPKVRSASKADIGQTTTTAAPTNTSAASHLALRRGHPARKAPETAGAVGIPQAGPSASTETKSAETNADNSAVAQVASQNYQKSKEQLLAGKPRPVYENSHVDKSYKSHGSDSAVLQVSSDNLRRSKFLQTSSSEKSLESNVGDSDVYHPSNAQLLAGKPVPIYETSNSVEQVSADVYHPSNAQLMAGKPVPIYEN
ncbi:hypothetical protein LEN26_015821 [Aphanomyces euteiches]|nr:hypothetical protein LEN26_015821 [Aphanomyces euteiches]KAH9107581.1 hypothetical protein AeMF1_017125 [Aphanomyces euteiches]KAH9183932.1 hypothetical protein AeNC1_014093 [Aphanomyces euteiches]